MPIEHDQQSSSDTAKSYVALNALRDYVYQQKPKSFMASDFVEDIPSLRPFGTPFANVLPSAAVFAKDPTERHNQIQQAVQSVNRASHKDHPLGQEVLTSAAKFGLGSIPFSLALGMAEKSVHIPKLRNMMYGESPRFTLKDNFSSPEKREELKKYLLDSVQSGVTQGSMFGATPPLLAGAAPIDKKHLDIAAKVLNEHPNISSLPGADLAALNNINRDKNEDPTKAHIKNTLVGGAMGGIGALAVQGLKSGRRAAHNVISPIKDRLLNRFGEKIHDIDSSMTPRGLSNHQLSGTGLGGSASNGGDSKFRDRKRNILRSLNNFFPKNQKSTLHSRQEILEPLTWKGMRKPVLGLAGLGLGLSGLGSYMTHPAHHKNV